MVPRLNTTDYNLLQNCDLLLALVLPIVSTLLICVGGLYKDLHPQSHSRQGSSVWCI